MIYHYMMFIIRYGSKLYVMLVIIYVYYYMSNC